MDILIMQLDASLQAVRPCRESETGWTLETEMFPVNHSSLKLSERGPALKVFWSRSGGMGASMNGEAEKTKKDKDAEVFNIKKKKRQERKKLFRM